MKNQKSSFLNKGVSTPVGLTIIIAVAVVLFCGAFAYQYFAKPQTPITNDQQNSNEQVMCTMDAMECPDGSYVGRTGPNCEFEECSEIKTDEIVKTKEQSCINSGGKVIMENCNCPDNVTPADFYNHCNMALNTCFCDPSLGIKRQLKSCDCGLNKCWNGTECSTI